jgi:hypothetical protein
MATLSFEAETHTELVAKVRRWLASVDGVEEEARIEPADAINQGAELAKEALRIIASSAPGPVAQSDVVKGLTALGYQMTDATSKTLVDALDTMSSITGGSIVKRVRDAQTSAVFEMNQAIAKQVLRGVTKAARGKS